MVSAPKPNLAQEARVSELLRPCTNKTLQLLVTEERKLISDDQSMSSVTGYVTEYLKT